MRIYASTAALLCAALLAGCGRQASQPAAPANEISPAIAPAAATDAPPAPTVTPNAIVVPCATPQPASLGGPPLPAYLGFLPCVMDMQLLEHWDWDEQTFLPSTVKQGERWHVFGVINGAATDRHQAWAALKADFVSAGWADVQETDTSPLMATMRSTHNGSELWAEFQVGSGGAERVDIEVIEAKPLPTSLTLAEPQPTPEKVDPATGDFPFLTPLPGSALKGGEHAATPFYLTLPGAAEPEVVATGAVTKTYQPPDGLSTLAWLTLYDAALTKAGWTVLDASRSSDAAITAHYGQNGRNIWAFLHMNGGGYSFQVGDEAAGGALAASLAKDCHVALTGVLFDFDKSTLKPESDPVLEKVLGLLTKEPALKLEVQGHTDNVGSDSYNQALSEARAAAVVAWLTQHGVAADRLSPKGYGMTMPIADNATDEGRAKNRRVEIANPACAPK